MIRRASCLRRVFSCAFALLLVAVLGFAHEGHEQGAEAQVMVIVAVVPAGPAADAGLVAGDRILSWDGQHIRTEADLGAFLGARSAGDEVRLEVERGGEALSVVLTLGDRGDGGPRLGLSLGVEASAPDAVGPGDGTTPASEKGQLTSDECRSWLRDTYKVAALSAEFGLDFGERLVEMDACVDRDLGMMPPSIPRGWCDNVFKVHCAGLDVLAEIGDLVVEGCESSLEEELGLDVTRNRTWNVCGEQKVFDAYSHAGIVSGPAACRRIFVQECGAVLEGNAAPHQPSSDGAGFEPQ